MPRTNITIIVICTLWLTPARAADIHLKSQATAAGPAVRLADLAEIYSPDDDGKLAEVELFGLPAKERLVTAQEIREALIARGVDLRPHTFSGASVIHLVPGSVAEPPRTFAHLAASGGQPINSPPSERPLHPAASAILKFLRTHVDAELPWRVELPPGGELPGMNAGSLSVIRVEQRPERGQVRTWLGRRQFVLSWTDSGRQREAVVTAEITLPPTVVVAARDLPRDTILQPADLKTKAAAERERGDGFEFVEDAIGQATLRTFRAGQVIQPSAVEAPELVRRGERVAVIVYHHGVRVRTEGRARESGARGDTVLVESPSRRQTYEAVVTGPNEVQVEAGSAPLARRPTEKQVR